MRTMPRLLPQSHRSQSTSRRWFWALTYSAILIGLIHLPGCGGGKGGGSGSGTGPETFNVTVNLTVQGAGNGNGQVSGSLISCQIQGGQASASGCQGILTISSTNLPSTVTLTASPAQGSTFVTWGGACAAAGSGGSCQLSVNSSTRTWNFNATAQFDLLPGSIQVTTATVGGDLDPDGYSLTIDQTDMGNINVTDVQTYAGLAAGDHSVTLGGIAENCTVGGDNPRTLTVNAGATTQTTFNVTCAPTTGGIQVTTITAGNAEDLDDGYTLGIDQGTPVAVGINETKAFAQLSPGDHTITLGDMAENCTLDEGENPRTVAVVVGQVSTTVFNLTCAPTKGDIQVATVTQGTGQDLDPDGYTVTVDQGSPTAIGINDSETFSQILAGGHTVTLGDIAGSCSLSGSNPRNVTVVAGGTTQVTFNVSCGAPTGIRLTTLTMGVLQPDTYTYTVDQGNPNPIGASVTVDIVPLSPGLHQLSLGGIPATCNLRGDNPLTATVVAGQLTQAAFVLDCVPPNGIAFEQVSARGDKDICVLDPYEVNPTVFCLTGGPTDTADDVHPVWGPNQEWILFSSDRDGDFEIYRMNADGTGVTQLTENTFFDGDPDVYFSGVKALFTSDRSGNKDIWEMDLTQPGYPVTQRTTDQASDFNPTWTYDTGYWMFTSNRDGDQDIWRGDPWGGIGQQTISDHDDDDAWYFPGYLYYSSNWHGTWDVIRSPNGLMADQFFSSGSTDKQPAPGPLFRWVAFTTNKDGNFELYKKNTVTGELVRLTDNLTSDSRPAWWAWWH